MIRNPGTRRAFPWPSLKVRRRRSRARRRSSRSCSASRARSTRRSISRKSTTSRCGRWTSCSSSITRSFCSLEPDGQTLRVVASRGYENQAIGGRVRVGIGAVGIVAQKRKILQLGNLGQQRAYASAQRRQMMKAGRAAEIGDVVPVPGLPNAESQIAIPLLIRDELVGVFSIESPVRQAFDEHDRSLVTIVANQIASAIRNAQLYDERRRAAEALQAANASLEARVAERTAALERELRVAEDLLNHARSRVDGPLIGESAAVRALRDAVAREAARTRAAAARRPSRRRKEAVAHALHSRSGRKGAFIFVSCPSSRRRAGIRRVARRRDARADRSLASKLELASGGTLFLEAVHELPPSISARAARHPRASGAVGATSDAVIASTTRETDVAWFAPLPAARSPCPPSRIGARTFRRSSITSCGNYARQLGKQVDGVSPESMRRLEGYAWPGNIRELAHRPRARHPGGEERRCSRSTKSCWTIDCRSAATA